MIRSLLLLKSCQIHREWVRHSPPLLVYRSSRNEGRFDTQRRLVSILFQWKAWRSQRFGRGGESIQTCSQYRTIRG